MFISLQKLMALLRSKSQRAFDPKVIEQVERAAMRVFPGSFVARHQPVATDTWEVSADLLSANPSGALVPIDFPGKIDLVGASFDILDKGTPLGLPPATINHIRIAFRVDDQVYKTVARFAGSNGQTVQASALSDINRILAVRLAGSIPKVAVQYFWRAGVQGTVRDVNIALAFFTNPLEPYSGQAGTV
jgi:hypothetical protein